MTEVSDAEIGAAVARLRAGGLVAMPTETVYGLAADASNDSAVRALFALKGRPANHPVIVHLPDAGHLLRWAASVPAIARQLAQHFWPGPLTMVLPRAPGVSNLITGGQDSVGLRVPAHPVALRLLAKFGAGLAAPSANRYGQVSPTTALHVRSEFTAELPMILDGGPCPVGIESTIVDLRDGQIRLLRPGFIAVAQLQDCAATVPGVQVFLAPASNSLRVPGSAATHYAPNTPVRLVATAMLASVLLDYHRSGVEVAVLAFGPASDWPQNWISAQCEPADYARQLYARLRSLDAVGCDSIVVELPPNSPDWLAVQDRLSRAATPVT